MDHPEPSQPGAPVTDGHTSKPCVLLVEDDRSLRRYFEVTLQRAGYEVIAAGDGLEAMKLALTAKVHVVVTDAIMPHLSGQQLAAFLRGHDRLANIPIVLLTGQENRSAIKPTNATIDAFLYKPIKGDELANCLAKLLNQSAS